MLALLVRLRRIVVIGLTRSTKQWQTFYIKKIKRLICDLKTYVPICQHFKTTEKPQFKYEKIKVIFKHYIDHFCKIYKHSVVLSYLYEVRFIYITDTGMWISRRQYCMNCIYTLYITVFSLVPPKRISCHPPTHLPTNPPTHQSTYTSTHPPTIHPSIRPRLAARYRRFNFRYVPYKSNKTWNMHGSQDVPGIAGGIK